MEYLKADSRHAADISRLLRLCYGESYPKKALYDPAQVGNLIESGALVSVIAVEHGRVAGHYALEIDLPPTLAMTGLALVDPAFRGGGLMHRLREAVESLAQDQGLEAIYGTAVTTHSRSQAAYDRLGNTPTGLLTGMAEGVDFANLDARSQNQLTLLHYFKLLPAFGSKVSPLCCPAPYLRLVQGIVADLGIETVLTAVGDTAGPGGFVTGPTGLGAPRSLWVPQAMGLSDLQWLDFPMSVDGWGHAFEQARQRGYRFASVVPLTPDGRFHMRLQKAPHDTDWAALELHNPKARRIRDFMANEATP